MSSTENLQAGDVVRVSVGSFYGPKSYDITEVQWVSANGESIRDAKGRHHATASVELIERAVYAVGNHCIPDHRSNPDCPHM